MNLCKCVLISISFFVLAVYSQTLSTEPSLKRVPTDCLTSWYNEPATDWMKEALPIGNGRIDAMIKGGIEQDTIQFNDKTLWTGNTTSRGAYQNFGNIRINFGTQRGATSYRRALDIRKSNSRIRYSVLREVDPPILFCPPAGTERGGALLIKDGAIQVKNADAATIIQGMGTNFSATNPSYITPNDAWRDAIGIAVADA